MGCFSSKEQVTTTEPPAHAVAGTPAAAAAQKAAAVPTKTTGTGASTGGETGGAAAAALAADDSAGGDAGPGPAEPRDVEAPAADAGGRFPPIPMPQEGIFERDITVRPNVNSLRALRTLDEIPLRRI